MALLSRGRSWSRRRFVVAAGLAAGQLLAACAGATPPTAAPTSQPATPAPSGQPTASSSTGAASTSAPSSSPSAAPAGAPSASAAPASAPPTSAAAIDLRVLGFENPIAIKPLQQVYQAYTQQHPNVKISVEITAYNTYIQQLATQISGGNPPDLMTTNLELIPEYAKRKALLDIDQLSKGAIDLSTFWKPALDANRVGGVLYGIPRDLAVPTTIYNATMYEKAGVKVPDQLWTWDDFSQTSTAIAKALGKGVYGTEDSSGNSYNGFEFWLRPKSKMWVTDEGKLGFEPQDLTDWLQFWAGLRASGAAPPGAVQAQETGTATSLLVTGKAAMFTTLTPQLATAAAAVHDQLGLHMLPGGFTKADLQPRSFAFGGASDSISAQSRHPSEAAQVVSYLLTDPQASQTYFSNGNRVPCASGTRAQLKQQLQSNHYVSLVFDYVDTVVQTPVKVANQGTNALQQLLGRTVQSVSTGQATITDAVNAFFTQAKPLTQ